MTDQAERTVLPDAQLPGETGSGDSGEPDRAPRATLLTVVDLLNLHDQMNYVARSLWDLQKCRVMVGNRTARYSAAPLTDLEEALKREEGRLNRTLESLAKDHPLAEWVQNTRGIGLPGFARLMGLTGPLDRFPNPAKLWKFVGMGVVDGRAPTKRRGEPWTHTDCKGEHLQQCPPTCRTDHHKNCRPGVKGTAYSAQARVVCFQLADSIVKAKEGTIKTGKQQGKHREGSPYRLLYDQKKAEYETRPKPEPSGCPLGKHHRNEAGKTIKCSKDHIHKAAMRYAVKRLLLDMWLEWRRRVVVGIHADDALPLAA